MSTSLDSQLEKQHEPTPVSDEQLLLINRYTRRALQADEVFTFSVVLCDNEIDRDFDRFTTQSLEALADLFLGKTGIFDHSAKSDNQSARIFNTALEFPGRKNSLGEDYCRLRAWAYMLRSKKNEELIFEIDGGIKKEVSVGCAVERVLCSICGVDHKQAPCEHQKGRRYAGDQVCHHLLENPVDAYEWSFVAIPAQKNAGVTKRAGFGSDYGEDDRVDLHKLFSADSAVTLSPGQLHSLRRQLDCLEERANIGDDYLKSLRADVSRLANLAQPELSHQLMQKLVADMSAEELRELKKSFARAAALRFPPSPQFSPIKTEQNTDNQFKI